MEIYFKEANNRIILNRISDSIYNIQSLLCYSPLIEFRLLQQVIKEADKHGVNIVSTKMHRADMQILKFIRRNGNYIREPLNYTLNSKLVAFSEYLQQDMNDNYHAVKYLHRATHIATVNAYGERLHIYESSNAPTVVNNLPILPA